MILIVFFLISIYLKHSKLKANDGYIRAFAFWCDKLYLADAFIQSDLQMKI